MTPEQHKAYQQFVRSRRHRYYTDPAFYQDISEGDVFGVETEERLYGKEFLRFRSPPPEKNPAPLTRVPYGMTQEEEDLLLEAGYKLGYN